MLIRGYIEVMVEYRQMFQAKHFGTIAHNGPMKTSAVAARELYPHVAASSADPLKKR
jgi:hypothetical protein